MKSTIISGPNLDELQFDPKHLTLAIDQHEIQQFIAEDFSRIAKQYGQVIDVDDAYAIEQGDIVQAKLSSTLPRYNKTIPLSIGRGLFDEEVEETIIGMKKQEEKTIVLQGEEVTIQIVSVKSRDIPEITVAMLQKEYGEYYPDAQTIEDFERHITEDRIEDYKYDHYFQEAAMDIGEKIIAGIDINLDEDDYQAFKDKLMTSLAQEALAEKIPLEEHLNYVFNTEETPAENLDDLVETAIKRDYIFLAYALDQLKDKIPPKSMEEYELEIADWAEATEKPAEEVRALLPYDEFVERSYVGEAQNRILDLFYQQLQVTLV